MRSGTRSVCHAIPWLDPLKVYVVVSHPDSPSGSTYLFPQLLGVLLRLTAEFFSKNCLGPKATAIGQLIQWLVDMIQRAGFLVSVWDNSEELHMGSAGLGPLSSLHHSSTPPLPLSSPAALTPTQVLFLSTLLDKLAHILSSQDLLGRRNFWGWLIYSLYWLCRFSSFWTLSPFHNSY